MVPSQFTTCFQTPQSSKYHPLFLYLYPSLLFIRVLFFVSSPNMLLASRIYFSSPRAIVYQLTFPFDQELHFSLQHYLVEPFTTTLWPGRNLIMVICSYNILSYFIPIHLNKFLLDVSVAYAMNKSRKWSSNMRLWSSILRQHKFMVHFYQPRF